MSLLATAVELGGTNAPILRQRACPRIACTTPAPPRNANCCDDSCLVEVARRECTKDGSHGEAFPLSESSTLRDSRPSKAEEAMVKSQPCVDHYQQTKDKYGAFLDHLGCICNILLSLHIDPCCVIQSHSPARSTGSRSSRNSTTPQGNATSCEVKVALDMQAPADCSKKSCCATKESTDIVSMDGPRELQFKDRSEVDYFINETSERFADVLPKIGTCQSKEPSNNTSPSAAEDLFISEKHTAEQAGSDMACSSKGCCDGSSTATRKQPCPPRQGFNSCSTKGCCGDSSPGPSKLPVDLPENGSCSTKRGCIDDSPIPAQKSATTVPEPDPCSTKGCCSSKPKPAINTPPRDIKAEAPITPEIDSCVKSCCGSKSISSKNLISVVTKNVVNAKAVADPSSPKACCSGKSAPVAHLNDLKHQDDLEITCVEFGDRKSNDRACTEEKKNLSVAKTPSATNIAGNCCSDEGFCKSTAVEISVSKSSTDGMEHDPDKISIGAQSQADDERALHGVEHVLVRVQGMDCTGCEVKLYKSLQNLPELSNIKTSLLLAQAEFDLAPSKSTNMETIFGLMEKMTGFTCTKITQFGVELEMIVDGSPKQFLGSWPAGVKEITTLTKRSIMVSYQPREIGARELLSDPFFQHAKLAPPSAPPLITSGRAHLLYTFYMTLLSVLLTIPVLALAWGLFSHREVLYGAISLSLATVVQTVVAGPFYTRTLNALIFSRMIDMDLLIVLSSTAAYIYSVAAYAYLAAGKPLETGNFFETSTLLVTLIMVGRTVSAFARQKAVESITIESLQTPTALIVNEATQHEDEIDARLLQYDDVFKVLPEMSVATDGVVVSGESEVDESMVTGEAILIAKKPGMLIIAGSINHSGSLFVRVTRLPHENTIKTIGAMVDEAKSSKPKVQELADRIASYFVPFILALTSIVFVVWIAVGITVRHQSASISAIKAMTYAITVLIVSCPCAVGLAVPMVVVIAGGVAARHGLIFKTAETIDIGRKISHVVFDKTGTLTQGKLNVVAEEYLRSDRTTIISAMLGLTTNSKHPVSKALASHLGLLSSQPLAVENIASVPGNGIEASFNGATIRAGNPYWLGVQDHPSVQRILTLGLTVLCVTLEGELVAIFGLQDLLRPDAIETIAELRKRSIKVSIISGDNQAAVQSIATELNIPLTNIRSRCSPERKQAYIKSLLVEGINKPQAHILKHFHTRDTQGTILFIGDGTNDAPSLAQASIGLHMSDGGTDVAQSAADAVLMRPSLKGILTLIDLSKAFHRRVVFNFTWSFVYNFSAILLASGVFGKARIPPEFAGLGEVVSVVPVVGAAVCLLWWKG